MVIFPIEAGFNTARGAQEMLVYQRSVFDPYYCIKTFLKLILLRKCFQKFFFPVPIMASNMRKVLKTPLTGQRLTSS